MPSNQTVHTYFLYAWIFWYALHFGYLGWSGQICRTAEVSLSDLDGVVAGK